MCIQTGNSEESLYETDVVVNARDVRLAMVVHGPPRAQQRPHFRSTRSGGYRVYSPSVRERNRFKAAIGGALNSGNFVYFRRTVAVKLKLVFFMPRPLHHFVGNVRRVDNIRQEFQGEREHWNKPDLDNLTKFVMDSLIGIAYEDDGQVYEIKAKKMYDNDGYCKGRISIDMKSNVIDLTD